MENYYIYCAIRAVPCNGIKECRDNKDENCKKMDISTWIWYILLSLYVVSLGISLAMNHYIKQQLIGPARTLKAIVEEYGGSPKSYRGNQLAYTKVRILNCTTS